MTDFSAFTEISALFYTPFYQTLSKWNETCIDCCGTVHRQVGDTGRMLTVS